MLAILSIAILLVTPKYRVIRRIQKEARTKGLSGFNIESLEENENHPFSTLEVIPGGCMAFGMSADTVYYFKIIDSNVEKDYYWIKAKTLWLVSISTEWIQVKVP